MKRRLFLLLGASTMTVTSLVGFTTATAAPASAAPNNIFVSIGYIIQCLTPQHLFNDFGVCLFNAIKEMAEGLTLPASFPNSSGATTPRTPAPGGNNAPLQLPGNVSSLLKNLPTALQTTPVAAAPTVNAPIKPLLPSFASLTGGASLASLPKLPTITPISFVNASDTKAPSSNPVSATDVVAIVALGLLGAGAVTARRRVSIAAS